MMVFLLSACGYAEWPPSGTSVFDVNTPPKRPVVATSSASFVGATAVIVGNGDTIYALSRRHKLSPRSIIIANGLRPPYRLTPGQKLNLPRALEHRVRSGETLYGIAKRYNLDVYELARLNTLKPPYLIKRGARLRLPGLAKPLQTAAVSRTSKSKSVVSAKTKAKVRSQAKTLKKSKPKPKRILPPPPKSTGKGFMWPVKGRIISGFGVKAKGFRNDGINIKARRGAIVRASENGTVAYAGNELRGFGNLLLIKHSGGWVSAYAHNAKLLVKRGQRVKKGQIIATVGDTGSVTTPQLHFELRRGRTARDPRKYLKQGA